MSGHVGALKNIQIQFRVKNAQILQRRPADQANV